MRRLKRVRVQSSRRGPHRHGAGGGAGIPHGTGGVDWVVGRVVRVRVRVGMRMRVRVRVRVRIGLWIWKGWRLEGRKLLLWWLGLGLGLRLRLGGRGVGTGLGLSEGLRLLLLGVIGSPVA